MELTREQLKEAEAHLKRYLPRSQQVYGFLVLSNRIQADPVKIFVDSWPEFKVIVGKPQIEEESDRFKDVVFFIKDETVFKEMLRNPSIADWKRYLCVGLDFCFRDTVEAVASEKNTPGKRVSVCYIMTLDDVSNLPSIDSSGILLSSVEESHISLVRQTWKFGNSEGADRMFQNMITHFPSCCVLDADKKPVAWILLYSTCAMGVLYTVPEHRGKGYAKVLISTMAKRLHAEGFPVFCLVEEENTVSFRLFKSLGFSEAPSYRFEEPACPAEGRPLLHHNFTFRLYQRGLDANRNHSYTGLYNVMCLENHNSAPP